MTAGADKLRAKWDQYLCDNSTVESAFRDYLQKYVERHGQVRLLGMPEPMPLKEIYTAVQMANPAFLRRWKSREELEIAFRDGNPAGQAVSDSKVEAIQLTSESSTGQNSIRGARGLRGRDFIPRDVTKWDGVELANSNQFLNVLGQPGAGKSTFLRRVGLDALLPPAERKYNHECIPIFVELKKYKTQRLHLKEIVRQEFISFGFPESFADVSLTVGKLLVLLDGLDEVPTEKLDDVIGDIKDFVDEHSLNRFITSCRTAFYKTWFTRFTDVVLADFDDEQIPTFLNNWFRSPRDRENETAEKYWQMLKRPENAATLELARTPLLLTFICLFHDGTQSLPANRSDLYEEAFKILLEKWAAEKRIKRETIYYGLTTKWEILLLEEIAGPAFEDDRIFFLRNELVTIIENYLENDLKAPRNLDGGGVLDAIEVQQGLLVQRAHSIYSFSHLTLQEYLAARYYLNTNKTKSVMAHFFEPRWREVFLLLVGMNRADEILLAMACVVRNRLNGHRRLCDLLKWVQGACRDCADASQLTARKAVVLFLVRALDPAVDYQKAAAVSLEPILDLALSLDSTLNLNKPLRNLRPLASSPNQPGKLELAVRLIRDIRDARFLKEGLTDAMDKALEGRFEVEKRDEPRQPFAPGAKDENPISKEHRVYSRKLKSTLLSALGVPKHLHSWTKHETEALEPLLYACSFLVECREAALSVNEDIWNQVVLSLLSTGSLRFKRPELQ
jgi:hypothetical protein